MIKELVAAWRGRDALSRMFDEFDRMLDETHWMFQRAVEVFFSRVDWQAVQGPLYQRDKEVNRLERSIRAQIVKHLTIRPDARLPACLVLMSVVKDAERIGDYCKNIFEVARFHARAFTPGDCLDALGQVRSDIEDLFRLTREAFCTGHVEHARRVIRSFEQVAGACDGLVQKLLREQERMPTAEAVACSLLARHLKRIGAHLANIATAVVAPIPQLDYVHEVRDAGGA